MRIPGGFHRICGEINFRSEVVSAILTSEMAECLQSLEASISRFLPQIFSEQVPSSLLSLVGNGAWCSHTG